MMHNQRTMESKEKPSNPPIGTSPSRGWAIGDHDAFRTYLPLTARQAAILIKSDDFREMFNQDLNKFKWVRQPTMVEHNIDYILNFLAIVKIYTCKIVFSVPIALVEHYKPPQKQTELRKYLTQLNLTCFSKFKSHLRSLYPRNRFSVWKIVLLRSPAKWIKNMNVPFTKVYLYPRKDRI